MFKFVLQFLAIVLVLCASSGEGAKPKAGCDLKNNAKLERDISRLLVLTEHGRLYPENRAELKAFCDETSLIVRNIDAYKEKCFTGAFKQYVSIFVYSNKNSIKRFCSRSANKKRINDLLDLAPCINQAKVRKGLVKCMNTMIEVFVGIKYASNNRKMGHLCCTVTDLIKCFERVVLKSTCKDRIELFSEFLQQITGNLQSDALCGDYGDDTDKCEKLPAPPKKKEGEKVPETLLYPFYDIVNSIPENR